MKRAHPMTATPKNRVVSALLLFWVGLPLAGVRSAYVPLHETPAGTAGQKAVAPHREYHSLSRLEIFRAIQNDLARQGVAGRDALRPDDLQIQSSISVRQDDVGLVVKRIGYDPIRREIVFEMWTSHESQYLPFSVTTRRDPLSLGLGRVLDRRPEDSDGEGSRLRQAASRTRPRPLVLAKPGKPSTLVMQGQNVRITTTVVPLQPGYKGQLILVRDAASARVMRAEVVDEGLLQTTF